MEMGSHFPLYICGNGFKEVKRPEAELRVVRAQASKLEGPGLDA